MDVWEDLFDDLWPEGADEEGSAIPYLRGRLNQELLRKAVAQRLAPNLWAEGAASLQMDWNWHYRFTYALMAPIIFSPADPAQWFVDLGLPLYPQKTRDVLSNIAIIERRQATMASLLPKQSVELADINAAAFDWIAVQAYPTWELAHWVLQIAVGLAESDNYRQAVNLLRELPKEHMNLLVRYRAALEMVVAAGKQAAEEAIDRPNQPSTD